MKNVRIGGVPEHFNYAWYLALKQGHFKQHDINVRWKDYFGGTGQMTQALRNNEIDMAVILTEGIIKDITEGNPSKIVQVFVESPLIWGIHVAHDSTFKQAFVASDLGLFYSENYKKQAFIKFNRVANLYN